MVLNWFNFTGLLIIILVLIIKNKSQEADYENTIQVITEKRYACEEKLERFESCLPCVRGCEMIRNLKGGLK